MDKEYYTSGEYKKIDEYKSMPAEDYRAKREYFGAKRELLSVPEDNHDTLRAKLKENPKASKQDDSGLKKILDKITTTSTTVATSTAVAVAGAGAVAVAPNIIPDLPPIIPDVVPVVDLSLGVIELSDGLEYVYNGEEIKPDFTLLVGGNEIDSKYYNIEYINNISPGLGTIKITSNDKGYKGEVSLDFIILKDENDINIRYNDGNIVISSKYSNGELKYYSDSECTNLIDKPVMPGTYYVRAEADEGDNYNKAVSNVLEYVIAKRDNNLKIKYLNGEIVIDTLGPEGIIKYYSDSECKNEIEKPVEYGHYYIRAYSSSDNTYNEAYSNILEYIVPLNLSDCTLAILGDSEYFYTGASLMPLVELKLNGHVIDPSLYKVSYLNNMMPGQAEIIVTPADGESVGENKISFTITKRPNEVTISGSGDRLDVNSLYGEAIIKYYYDKECLKPIGFKPTDYGHYYIRAEVAEGDTFLGALSNVIEYNVSIDLSKCIIELLPNDEIRYTGNSIEPRIVVKLDGIAIDEALYKIEYSNNIRPGRAGIKVLPVNSESKSEASTTFEILKAINNVTLTKEGSEYIIDTLHGTGSLKYYSDIDCKLPISRPTELGKYYIRAEVVEDDTYLGAVSDALEYDIVLRENDIWIGNTKLEFDLTLKEGLSGYKIAIKDDLTSAKPLNPGGQKILFENLTNSKEYTIVVYTGELNTPTYNEYYSKQVTTMDGSKPIIKAEVNGVKSKYSETTKLSYRIILDGLSSYDDYIVEFTDSLGNTQWNDLILADGLNEQVLDDSFEFGNIIMKVYGRNAGEIDINSAYEENFNYQSVIPLPEAFDIKYEAPKDISEVVYSFMPDGNISLEVPIILIGANKDDRIIKVTVTPDKGEPIENHWSGIMEPIIIPGDSSYAKISYTEMTTIDLIEKPYKTYDIQGLDEKGNMSTKGALMFNEIVNAKTIMADNNSGKLNLDFDIRAKSGTTGVLRNKTLGTEEALSEKMSLALPSSVTDYEYQLINGSGTPIGSPKSFRIDPAHYNPVEPIAFSEVAPKDIVKTYNGDTSWNMYVYTGFKPANQNQYWILETTLRDEYDPGLIEINRYKSNAEVIEVLGIRGYSSLKYYLGEEIDGIFYIRRSVTPYGDTRTDMSDYKSYLKTSNDGVNTTVTLELSALDRIYDLNGTILYVGAPSSENPDGNRHILGESDFKFDSSLNAYVYTNIFPGVHTDFDFILKSNKNVKNLADIKRLTTVKGDLYTNVNYLA